MSIRATPFVPGEYYHIYNRGTDKRRIFEDENDYRRFIAILYLANSDISFRSANRSTDPFTLERGKPLVSIGAYCLMPNHFHLLVTQSETGDISRYMHKLLTSYGMYYNIRHERSGRLFENKFKSSYADDDRYLKYLFSYIHLNPIKLIEPKWKETGIKDSRKTSAFLDSYPYSSYADYNGLARKEGAILDRAAFPDYFPDEKSFQKEIFDWISFQEI